MNLRKLGERVTDMLASPPVSRTREWLREQHPAYPAGVSRVATDSETNEVCLYLSTPLDTDNMATVADARGFEYDQIETAQGVPAIRVFTTEEVDTGVSRANVVGTFPETRVHRLGLDPVTDYQTDPALVLLTAYLAATHSSTEP